MTELERVTKLVEWLIYDGIASSRRDLAIKLGYTESSMSQILNGKVNLSEKFIKKLSNIDSRINGDWVSWGVGTMIDEVKNDNNHRLTVDAPPAKYGGGELEDKIPFELYKLTLENEKLSKEKELELIKQNGQLIEMLKKAYDKIN